MTKKVLTFLTILRFSSHVTMSLHYNSRVYTFNDDIDSKLRMTHIPTIFSHSVEIYCERSPGRAFISQVTMFIGLES